MRSPFLLVCTNMTSFSVLPALTGFRPTFIFHCLKNVPCRKRMKASVIVSPLGRSLACVPTAQASVERVFSTAENTLTGWRMVGV